MAGIVELMETASDAGFLFGLDGEGFYVEGPVHSEMLAVLLIERRYEIGHLISDPPISQEGDCADCGERWSDLIAGLCYRCGELRKFLSNDEPCGCQGRRRWRYPDGFRWHCGNCEQAPKGAVWSRPEIVS